MDYRALQNKIRKLRDDKLISSRTSLRQNKHSLERVYGRYLAHDIMDQALALNLDERETIPIKLTRNFAFKDIVNNVKLYPDKLAYVQFEDSDGREKVYALTPRTIKDLKQGYRRTGSFLVNQKLQASFIYGSDEELITYLLNHELKDGIRFGYYPFTFKHKQEGAFFPYTHNLDFDLSRYQIYKEQSIRAVKDNCFIHSLKMSKKFSDAEIDSMKLDCCGITFPLTALPDFAKDYKFSVKLTRPRKDNKDTRVTHYNKDCERVIHLGLIEEHYFIIEDVNLTSYAIANYDAIKYKKNWNLIAKSDFTTNKSKILNSYQVITRLIENKEKLLNPLTYNDVVKENLYNSKYTKIDNLDYIDNCRAIVFSDKSFDKDGKKRVYDDFVFFDSETGIDDSNKHIPYLLRSSGNDLKLNEFKGDYCIVNFLNSLKANSYCIAHNLGYDMTFLMRYITVFDIIEKPRVIFLRGIYRGKRLSFNCSLAKMGGNMALSQFKDVFKLDVKKEILPYALYNYESTHQAEAKIEDALKHIEIADRDEFLSNIENQNCKTREGYFDHMKYSSYYCGQDVKVTREGYNIFRKWMLEITNLDCNDYVTLSSLAYAYVQKEGCFEGCFNITGIPREFIQRCIVGGRVMTNSNKMVNEEESISDFDGVSLYPSAMVRLGQLGGFLKGKPKVIKDLTYDFLKNQDSYFALINVKDVKIKRDFPLLNKKNEDTGVIDFSNNIRGEIYIDKIGLEDLITYHDIDFDIISGYYFNEGRNPKITEVITHLFEARVKAKAKTKEYPDGNPIQESYKLILNSIYGKTCLNPIKNETKIIHENDLQSYISNNYNFINNYSRIPNSNKFVIDRIKERNLHFNACHIGCEVLSMSKRIMNEVICLAEDHHIKIYYQDTDSLHIKTDKIELLSALFKMKYKRELVGKGLGQFHSDFKLKGADESKPIVAIKTIALGKKSYIDRLEGTKLILDKDKKKIETDEKIYGYHIRMKGIPTKVIIEKARVCFDNDPMKLYKHLLEHNEITFNILDDGSVRGKFCCKTSSNFDIHTIKDFTRTVKY